MNYSLFYSNYKYKLHSNYILNVQLLDIFNLKISTYYKLLNA